MAGSGADTITFALPDDPSTISLNSELLIADDLQIRRAWRFGADDQRQRRLARLLRQSWRAGRDKRPARDRS